MITYLKENLRYILLYMASKLEPLRTENIIEIERIAVVLKDHPDLLSIFKLLCIIANKRLNDERIDTKIIDMIDEEEEEPELSDHTSDED